MNSIQIEGFARVEVWPIERLIPADYNPREDLQPGDPEYDAILNSVKVFGMVQTFCVNERTGNVVGGHQRAKVCKALGYTEAIVQIGDWDDEEERELNIALNEISGRWDRGRLKTMVKRLAEKERDLSRTGMTPRKLRELLNEANEKPEKPPKEKKPWKGEVYCQEGEIWTLGRHRIYCGNSLEDWEPFRQVEAGMVFTSPPYNLASVQHGARPNATRSKKYKKSADSLDGEAYKDMLQKVLDQGLIRAPWVFFNVQPVAGCKRELVEFLYSNLHRYADTVIWDRDHAEPALAIRVMNSRYELIPVFGRGTEKEPCTRAIGTREFKGTVPNLIQVRPELGAVSEDEPWKAEHGATMPLDLASWAVSSFTNSGETVIDPFLGTGTTLIACELHGRACIGIDLDPGYLDATIVRWQNLTRKQATNEAGQPFPIEPGRVL